MNEIVNYDQLMKELAEYSRMQEEVNAAIDALKDELKTYMLANGLDTLTGGEHKATYKPVSSSRVDTAALKKELPDIAKRFTKKIESMRFTFA